MELNKGEKAEQHNCTKCLNAPEKYFLGVFGTERFHQYFLLVAGQD